MSSMLPTSGLLSLPSLSASAVNVAGLSPAAIGAAPGSVLPSAVATQAANQAPFSLALPPLTLPAQAQGAGYKIAGPTTTLGQLLSFGGKFPTVLLPLSPLSYSANAGFLPPVFPPFLPPFCFWCW